MLDWHINFEAEIAIKMKNLQGKNVLILGLGVSGLAMARWCVRLGANVTVIDSRANPPNSEVVKNELSTVRILNGDFSPKLLTEGSIDILLVSPGIRPKDFAEIFKVARSTDVTVSGELCLFSQALASLKESNSYSPQVLAITGTNGKTTVTSLTGKLIDRAGKSVVVAGNIGPSMLDELIMCLDREKLPDVWVLELSSFQLSDVDCFEPTAGVILNITPDHLDWHEDIEAYARAKMNVFGKTTKILLNRNDEHVMRLAHSKEWIRKNSTPYLTFGTNAPSRIGDYGLESVDNVTWLVKCMSADDTGFKNKKNAKEAEVFLQRLVPTDALQIRGEHNAANGLAALALAETAGCALAPMLFAIREYRGEPHRVESIGHVNGVEYIDDSKGTNVGATVAALKGLGKGKNIILILGGDAKGQSFTALLDPVIKHVRVLIVFGKDKPLIQEFLSPTGIPIILASDMASVVTAADEHAQEGNLVLLSPACASLDMYKNYEHRSQVFIEQVKRLAEHTSNKEVL